MRTKVATLTSARAASRCYLAEVKLSATQTELSWIGKSLQAASLRLRGSACSVEVVSAAYIPEDRQLACIVEAGCADDVHRLFGIALLPSARVVGASVVALNP
jgi:hypothetical protein